MIDEDKLFVECAEGARTEVLNSEQGTRHSDLKVNYKFALGNLVEGRLVIHILRHGFFPSEICSVINVSPEELRVEDLVLLLERALFGVHNEAISPDKSALRLLERLSEIRGLIRQHPDVGSMSVSKLFSKTLLVDMQTLERQVKGACHGRC